MVKTADERNGEETSNRASTIDRTKLRPLRPQMRERQKGVDPFGTFVFRVLPLFSGLRRCRDHPISDFGFRISGTGKPQTSSRCRYAAPLCRCIIGIAAVIVDLGVSWSRAAAQEPVELSREQKQFLSSLIPRVPAPKPTEQQSDQGMIIYWADPTSNFYINTPPGAEDLGRRALIRTPAGEDEPLLLAVWGLRRFDHATVKVIKPFFQTTVGGAGPGERLSPEQHLYLLSRQSSKHPLAPA